MTRRAKTTASEKTFILRFFGAKCGGRESRKAGLVGLQATTEDALAAAVRLT